MLINTPRRDFLKASAAAGVGFWVAGRQTWADELASKSPNEQISVASIGVGGKGSGDCDQAALHANLVAICDVDENILGQKAKKHPKARKFTDFRKMLDEMGKEIDAVTISTPDHQHAVATMMAIKMGKHVYTQKPLTHDVWEARQLRLAAREHKVATQMGNQGAAGDRFKEGLEVIRAGMIGAVKEVHIWTDRPIWPQSPKITARPASSPVPPQLAWDLWLGTAPERPFAKDTYHTFKWRGWWDFGTGALGDMGCHLCNQTFRSLDLGHPSTVWAESEQVNPETYPGWARVVSEFPARGSLPPVTVTWYEGHKDGNLVLPPSELTDKVLADYNKILLSRQGKNAKPPKPATARNGGCIMVGDKGIFYSPGGEGGTWELLPAESFHDYKAPPQIYPRASHDIKNGDENHKVDWLTAARGGPPAQGNFDIAGMLAEFVLLGNVAIRAGGIRLEWDGANMKFPNAPQAERFLKRAYREPWSL